jgi:hypothetical protein
MTRPQFWTLWITANVVWLIGLPLVFGVWLYHEVQAEYASGARVSTDGDSIGIPIGGVALLNLLLLLAMNVALAIYFRIRRSRAT